MLYKKNTHARNIIKKRKRMGIYDYEDGYEYSGIEKRNPSMAMKDSRKYSIFVWVLMAIFLVLCVLVCFIDKDRISGIQVNGSAIENGATNDKPFAFLYGKEIWIHVHWSMPTRLRMLYVSDSIFGVTVKGLSVVVTVLIILLWEVFETVVYSTIKQVMWDVKPNNGTLNGNVSSVISSLVGDPTKTFAEWFGEKSGDSMIGDVSIGTVGILCGTFVMYLLFNGTKNNIHLSARTKMERSLYYVLFVLEALSTVLATFMVKISTPATIPKFMNPDFGVSNSTPATVQYFALGHIVYIIISISLLQLMKNIDVRAASRVGTEKHVFGVYDAVMLFHMATWFGTFMNLSVGYMWVTAAGLCTFAMILFVSSVSKNNKAINELYD